MAVVALALHVFRSPESNRVSAPAPNRASQALSASQDQSADVSSTEVPPATAPKIEGPWLATQTFFHRETKNGVCRTAHLMSSGQESGCAHALDLTQVNEVEACAGERGCRDALGGYFGARGRDVQYMIATIPDPLHTRLALLTDSSIEAINQAAFDSHWELAAQWLPWYDSANLGEKDPEDRRKERASVRDQESQPGLMVFRHSPVAGVFDGKALFVFLVGETPTAGLNGVEYRMARAYMRALGDPQDIRLVGPTFSGSFDSLAELIAADRRRSHEQNASSSSPQFWVHTGTATNAEAEWAFLSKANAHFTSSNQNSEDDLHDLNLVLSQLRIPPSQAATLVEDDTAYSKGFTGSHQKSALLNNPVSRILRFPRDISHLRNVYRNATAASPQTSTNGSPVDFSLKDSDSGEDTVPVFSTTQTPLSQNAVIGELVNEIRSERIRLLELAATNVLDSLFLANVIRRQCPDTRLLITSPDLLFVQATQIESLDGILALSAYPLFSASKRFLRHGAAQSVDHASANAAGIYTATSLYLLPPEDRAALNPYMGAGAPHPPAWLMQLNRQGFTPIRMFNNDDEGNPGKAASGPSLHFRMPYPSGLWITLTSLLAMFNVFLCAWIFHLQQNPRAPSWSIPAADGDHIADAYRLMFLLYALLTLASAQAVLYIPLATSLPNAISGGLEEYVLHALAICGFVAPLAVSLWLVARIFEKPRLGAARFVYAAAGFIMLAWVCTAWLVCCLRDSRDHAGFFFAFRAMEMRTGTSPAVPVFILLAALFFFAMCHLVRFYFVISQRPRLFTATLDRFLKGRIRNCRSDLNRALVSPMNLSGKRQLIYLLSVLGVIALAGALCRADQKLSTPEGGTYDTLVITLVTLVTLAIFATALQVKFSWAALQPLLVRLDLLPMGSAFSALRDAGRNGPIWARRLNLQSLDIPTRSVLVLHNLKVSLTKQQDPFPTMSPDRLQTWIDCYWEPLSRLISERRLIEIQSTTGLRTTVQRLDRLALRREFGAMRYRSADISHELTERILIPEWRKRSLPWTSTELAGSEKNEVEAESCYDLAQTFVALQFSMFINYGLRQIQNLLVAVSLGYGLLVAALSVYRFEAPQLLGRLLLAGFVILGVFTWRVMSQMERNPILSRLSGTKEGELNREFYLKLVGYATIPVLSIVSSQFPAISGFLSSWVQPSLEALK